MTLQQVFNEAMALLGYTNQDGVIDNDNTMPKILSIGNAIYAELQDKTDEFDRLISIDDEIPLSDRVIMDCMVYGIAMWLALHNSDGDNQQIFSSLYEQKKHNLIKQTTVKDVFAND